MESQQTSGILVDRVLTLSCGACGCEVDVSEVVPFVKVQCPDCGHVETVPARLDHFLLLDLLGTGGMGGVYLARDEVLGRSVAIKVMLQSVNENREFVERFRREAQAAARLNHPSIAQIYEFGEAKNQPYIVMELVAGKSFDSLISSGTRLEQSLVLQIGMEIAEGLQAANEIGLVHGDIKPENILLDEKMHAKLVDFGIATFADQAAADGIWGTPHYIPPEKIRRQKTDASSDIYSLGATLYHALAGRPPFDGETPVEVVKARLEHPPRPLRESREDLDPHVESIVERMLQAQPARRYPTYASLISDMRKALEKLGPAGGARALPGGRSRRVVIKKRGTAGRAAPPETAAVKPAPAGKIVVHRGAAESSGAGAAETEPGSARRGRSRAFRAALWMLLAAALVLAGVHFIGQRRLHREQARRRAVEASALFAAREQARGAYADVRQAVTNVVRSAASIQPHVDTVTNAVFLVLEEVLTLPETSPNGNDADPETATPGVDEGAEAEIANGVTDTNGADAAVPDEHDAGEPEPAPDPGADEADAETEAAIPDPDDADLATEPEILSPEAPEREDEPVKRLAKEVFQAAHVLRAVVGEAHGIESSARGLLETAQRSDAAGTVDLVVGKLREHERAAVDLQRRAEGILREAAAAAREADAIRQRTEAERAARREAEVERRRRELEEAAARRAEAEQAARVQAERSRVATLESECLPLLKSNRFDEALERAAAQRGAFETEEGRTALRVVMDRYGLLREMKEFLVEQLQRYPFKWGWGPAHAAADVLGADADGVRVRGRAVPVPWEEVGPAQMLKFLRHYLASDRVRHGTRARQHLAAAVFSHVHGGADLARQFADRAVSMSPHLAGDARRLIPEPEGPPREQEAEDPLFQGE